jgi:hypothetical protein
MTDTRPPFTLSDIPATIFLAALGTFLGAGGVLIAVLLYQGTWVALLLIIGVVLFQLAGQGILHLIVWAIASLWALLWGRPLPVRPPSIPAKNLAAPPQPWLRRRIFDICFLIAFAFTVFMAWQSGAFGDWGI